MPRDDIGFGREPHASYAVSSALSRGRRVAEPESPTRTPFQRDRDRIIHSTAFRRLKHKTQVFVYHEGDHYRTRLTHTIEVAQIARAIARALRVDEDLAEALALAHDLGHTPFGHTGEEALHAVMAPYGGFDHNAQTLRIVTKLERRYAEFDGLNLAWETLEGLVKHNGPLTTRDGTPLGKYAKAGLPAAFKEYEGIEVLDLWSYSSVEAQAAAIADDIAYDAHDIDDGLRAGLFSIDDLLDVPLLAGFIGTIRQRYPNLELSRMINELTRRLITAMVEDAIATALANLREIAPHSAEEVRGAGRMIVTFSAPMADSDRAIKDFLFPKMYRHPNVMRVRRDADRVVRDLFAAYIQDQRRLPAEWALPYNQLGEAKIARRVADYIAGMTDGFALTEHRRWFDDTPELR